MSQYLIEQIDGIAEHRGPPVHRGRRRRTATSIWSGSTLRDAATGETETVDAPWLFVFIGAEPRTDWLDGMVARDARGFVLTGPDLLVDGQRPPGWPLARDPYHLESSVPGVFAAGDVRAELGQAGRLRRRRGRHGRLTGPPLPGGAVTAPRPAARRDELRTLFLFEALDDEQLAGSPSTAASSSYGGGTWSTPRASRRPASRAARAAPSR